MAVTLVISRSLVQTGNYSLGIDSGLPRQIVSNFKLAALTAAGLMFGALITIRNKK
jgi:hypothetical protein